MINEKSEEFSNSQFALKWTGQSWGYASGNSIPDVGIFDQRRACK